MAKKENREGTYFYKSWFEQIKEMTKEEGYEYMIALLTLAIDKQEIPVSSGIVKIAFTGAKAFILTNLKKANGGKKGGRGNKKTETNAFEKEKPMVSENENLSQYNTKTITKTINQDQDLNTKNLKESNREVRSPQFKKPTIAEIQEYCRQRGNNVDAEQFFSFYESNGWKVGRVPMKDWKMCVITWEKRHAEDKKRSSYSKYGKPTRVPVTGDYSKDKQLGFQV